MRKPRVIRNSAIAIAASALMVLATATPASAITYTRSCGAKNFYIGVVTSGAWADDRSPMGDCGTVAIRVRYNLPIGVTVTGSWITSSNFASVYIPAGSSIVSADARAGNYYYYGLKKM